MSAKGKRARRKLERPIDKLVDPSEPKGLTPALLDKFEKRWSRISLKCEAAYARQYIRSLNPAVSSEDLRRLNAPSLNDAEMCVLSEFLNALMRERETESWRRSLRDTLSSMDFVFHREVLKHDVVMVNVCPRWGVSESTVKQAVKRERESALQAISDEKSAFRTDRTRVDKTLVDFIKRRIEANASAYRDGKSPYLVPRPRRRPS